MTVVLDGSVVLRADRVVCRPQDGRVLVYRPATDQLFMVPALAEQILRTCDGLLDLDTVLTRVGVTTQTVGPDGVRKVLAMVSGLIDRDVLSVVTGTTGEGRSG